MAIYAPRSFRVISKVGQPIPVRSTSQQAEGTVYVEGEEVLERKEGNEGAKNESKWNVLSTGACLVDLPGVRDANAARARVAERYLLATLQPHLGRRPNQAGRRRRDREGSRRRVAGRLSTLKPV